MPHSDPITALGELDPATISADELAELLDAATDLATSGAEVDLSMLRPQQFARLIARASPAQLASVTQRPELRERILDEVFRRMGAHYRPDRARTSAVVRWRISDGDGDEVLRYECVLAQGTCTVNKPPEHDQPRATIMLGAVDFLRVAAGTTSAPVLFMKGKLKVSGDLGFAAGLTKLFQIPKA